MVIYEAGEIPLYYFEKELDFLVINNYNEFVVIRK